MAYLAGFGAEGDHLRARFQTQWKATRGFTDAEMRERVAWPNEDFTPPKDSMGRAQSWVRFGIRRDDSERADIAPNPRRRYYGTVVIEVFVPRGTGEGTVDDLCDDVAAVFRDYTGQQGLRIGTPQVREVGERGSWYKKDVLVPFQRDTVHS